MDTHSAELERDQLIRALQARERFLDAVLGSLETFFTVDADWRITFANSAAATMARLTPDEMLGRELWELMPADQHQVPSQELRRAMGERVGVEYEMATGDGRTFHGKAYPLADGGLAVYVRDVSERATAKAALAEAERRHSELVQGVNSVILRWSREGTITFFNEYGERLFGWRADEVVGRHVNILLPESDRQHGNTDLSHLAEDIIAHPQRYSSNVNVNQRKDGSLLWIAWTNRALTGEDGEVVEVLAVGNDITELVEAQDALRESEERFRTLADHSPFLIWVAGVDGGTEFVNRTYLEFFGVTEDEITGTGWAPLVHPQDIDRYRGEFLAAVRERRPFVCEARVRGASGEWRWIDSHAVPRSSGSGEFLGMVGSSADVTARKESEQALLEDEAERAARQERERLARDLHDSVTQALFAANLKAEALSLAEGEAAERALDELQRLNRGALAQMRTLLVELRGEALDEVPIQQLLRNVVEATESRASVSVRLSVSGDGALSPRLHTAVYRIVQEALNNVARHAGADHAWVELRLGAGEVRLEVGDDGCGFTSTEMDATHMGLRSMQERAEEAGARLHVDSAVGRGTLVTLEWSAVPEASPA